MNFTPVKTPKALKKLFPKLVWSINTTQKELYLTFDDGPTPKATPWVLNQLKLYNAKATFFCIGNNVKKHPEIFKQILSEGHAVGNHTYNHLKGWKVKTLDYINDVKQCEDLFKSQIQNSELKTQKLFRPPYGKIKPKQVEQIQKLNYNIVMWDVLSIDWDKNVSPEQCLKNVLNNTNPGSIIVFHDSLKAEKNMTFALPEILKYFNDAGYTFKTL